MKYYAIANYYDGENELFEFNTKKELEKELKENRAIQYVFYGNCIQK